LFAAALITAGEIYNAVDAPRRAGFCEDMKKRRKGTTEREENGRKTRE